MKVKFDDGVQVTVDAEDTSSKIQVSYLSQWAASLFKRHLSGKDHENTQIQLVLCTMNILFLHVFCFKLNNESL